MAVGLVLLSLVTHPYAYLAVWALLGRRHAHVASTMRRSPPSCR